MSVPSGSSDNHLTHGKQLSVLLVLAAILYHAIHHLHKENTCDSLLTDGSFASGDIWQPRGCLMRNYTPHDTSQCLAAQAAATGRTTRLVFVGDSRVRGLYNGILEQLRVEFRVHKGDNPTIDYNVEELRLETQFLFRPHVTEKLASELLNRFNSAPPSLVVVSGILHSLIENKNHSNGLTVFRKGLTALNKNLAVLPVPPPTLFMLSEHFNLNITWSHRRRRNDWLDEYNNVALEVLQPPSAITPWRSIRLIGTLRNWDYTDGIHAGNKTIKYFVQVFLNHMCNRHLAALQPDVCCGPSPRVDLPVVAVLVTMACSLGFLYLLLRLVFKPTDERVTEGTTTLLVEKTTHQVSPVQPLLLNGLNYHSVGGDGPSDCQHGSHQLLDLVWALFKLTLILGYFALSERVNLFPKVEKEFSLFSFLAPILAALVAATLLAKPLPKITPFGTVHRDVTDEWKGWMQLVLVVYHGTGSSQNLLIYMQARILVAAYLFLTGYGHFVRFWKTGGTGGFRRYCQSMFRLNFLTVLLCLVMDQPYMNYYFTALVSFWFTLIHVVLTLPPGLRGTGPTRLLVDYGIAAFKILLLTILVVVLAMSKELFEGVFVSGPLGWLFSLGPEDGLHEWRFRWMLDRWSPLYGMVFGLIAQSLNHYTSEQTRSSAWTRSKLRTVTLGLMCLAIGFSSYVILANRCGGKVDCNALHPYFAWTPILGYLIFRHQLTLAWPSFSPLFVWMGRISLEIFVCQYHILLSHNTRGLLVLIPGLPLVNAMVTGAVLLSSAHELRCITEQVQQVIFDMLPRKKRQ